MTTYQQYEVQNDTPQSFPITITGRVNWAIEQLLDASATGCTPITRPAPRWSDYMFRLRGLGVDIETIYEKHEREFPGHHARNALRSKVSPDSSVPSEEAA